MLWIVVTIQIDLISTLSQCNYTIHSIRPSGESSP